MTLKSSHSSLTKIFAGSSKMLRKARMHTSQLTDSLRVCKIRRKPRMKSVKVLHCMFKFKLLFIFKTYYISGCCRIHIRKPSGAKNLIVSLVPAPPDVFSVSHSSPTSSSSSWNSSSSSSTSLNCKFK
jgi:hypothetical protein